MTKNPVSLEKWRDYFSGADSDIFSIIEHAILVAASDFPFDFKLKRDQIAEMLFTCKATKCLGCLRTENCGGGEYKTGVERGGSKGSRESKVGSNKRDEDDVHNAKNRVVNQDYDGAELLIGEIEETTQILEDVLRIKKVLDDREQSDEVLFDLLRKLQLMPLSLEILKETCVGKSVNALRKQRSKEIRDLAKRLVEDWKLMVDAFYAATPIADVTPESAKTSYTLEEGGLPSPPLDEGAFLATPSMELSQIFDGMDDDGNLRTCGELIKNRQNGTIRSPNESSMPPKDSKGVVNRRNQESTSKKGSPPCKPDSFNVVKAQENGTLQKKPLPQQQEKLKRGDEAPDMRKKLEDSKRKLQERYQEARNAKKMRTIKVVELNELPKQCRDQVTRPCSNQHRRW